MVLGSMVGGSDWFGVEEGDGAYVDVDGGDPGSGFGDSGIGDFGRGDIGDGDFG